MIDNIEWWKANRQKLLRGPKVPFQYVDFNAYQTALYAGNLDPNSRLGSWQLPHVMPVAIDWSFAGSLILGSSAPLASSVPISTNITGSYLLSLCGMYVEWSFAGFRRTAFIDVQAYGTFIIGPAEWVQVSVVTAGGEMVPVTGAISCVLRPAANGERSNARTSFMPFSVQNGSPITALMYLGPDLSKVWLNLTAITPAAAQLIVDFQTANLSSLGRYQWLCVANAVGGAQGMEDLCIAVPNACTYVVFTCPTVTGNITVGMSRVLNV